MVDGKNDGMYGVEELRSFLVVFRYDYRSPVDIYGDAVLHVVVLNGIQDSIF